MRIVLNKHIPFGSFAAMCIGPWIFVKDINKVTTTLINHEAIHWEQQKETLIVGFFILYGIMFLWELVRCTFDPLRANHADGRHRPLWKRAYRSVAFEQEAYAHETDMEYIKTRKIFSFWSFMVFH